MIFWKQCTIFEHTFWVWCSIFDHQTQMTLHNERLLTAPVRNPNTGSENRVLFSNTSSEFVIENRTPQGSLGKTCAIFGHRSGLGCSKFDHLARGIQAFSTYSPKYGMSFGRRWGFSRNRVLFSNTLPAKMRLFACW
jgi:hypothetical protein